MATKKQILEKENNAILLAFGAFLIALNLFVSFFLEYVQGDYILNQKPFGFDISIQITSAIAAIALVVLYFSKSFRLYPVASVLIVSGSISNVIERFIVNGVRDYLDIGIAMINFADIQLWLGLAILNYKVWFGSATQTIAKSSTKKSENVYA